MQKKDLYISKKNGGKGVVTPRPRRMTVKHEGRFDLDFPLRPVEMPPPSPVVVAVDANGRSLASSPVGKTKGAKGVKTKKDTVNYNESIPVRFPTYLNDPALFAEEEKPKPSPGPKALIPIRKGLPNKRGEIKGSKNTAVVAAVRPSSSVKR